MILDRFHFSFFYSIESVLVQETEEGFFKHIWSACDNIMDHKSIKKTYGSQLCITP